MHRSTRHARYGGSSAHLCQAVWLCCALISVTPGLAQMSKPDVSIGATKKQDAENENLTTLVERYFRHPGEAGRGRLVPAIGKAAGQDPKAVADAMKAAKLWEPIRGNETVLVFRPAVGDAVHVLVRLPGDYDPDKAHPMLICLGDDGAAPAATLSAFQEMLGQSLDGFVLACPARRLGGTFHQQEASAGDFRRLVVELRKTVHTDTDRLYMIGWITGGDAAWVTALNHADLLAGVIVLDGFPRLPYVKQTYPMLLPGLANVPVLSIWSAPPASAAPTRAQHVAAHNRYIAQIAKAYGLPFVSFEIPDGRGMADRPFKTSVDGLLARPRDHRPAAFDHWFRYPDHGWGCGVRQLKFGGDVWTDDQLSILPASAAEADAFITQVFRSKLAYLGGKVQGNRIDIETHLCARVAIDLPLAEIDWDRPVVIRCNGQPRRDDVLKPSISKMLEHARETWSFAHPIGSSVSLLIKTPAKPSGQQKPG